MAIIIEKNIMAKIVEFKGYRYNAEKVNPIDVLCPPYDIIEREMYLKIINGNPLSFANLIRSEFIPPPEGWYEEVKRKILDWIDRGILFEEEKPSIYIYRHRAQFSSRDIERTGIIALLYNRDSGGRRIIPHEKTYEVFKKDRFNLATITGFQLEPIFCIFPDHDEKVKNLIESGISSTPIIEGIGADGIYHLLCRKWDRDFVEDLKSLLSSKDLMIADGHHRFEASRMIGDYLEKMGEKGEVGRFVLSFIVPFSEAPIGVYPIHRGLKSAEGLERILKENFFCIKIKEEEINSFFETNKKENGRFVLFRMDEIYACYLKKKKAEDIHPLLKPLDVAVLHHFLIDRILPEEDERGRLVHYTPYPEKGIEMFKNGEIGAFFLLPDFYVGHVFDAARISLKLPHKSTFFYPKISSGMVFYKIK